MLSPGAFTSVDRCAGVVVGVRRSAGTPSTTSPRSRWTSCLSRGEGAPFPRSGPSSPPSAKSRLKRPTPPRSPRGRPPGRAGEIDGDGDLEDDGDGTDESERWTVSRDKDEDFRPEGESSDAGETLADLALDLDGPGESSLSPADAESGQEGGDDATLYDFLKTGGRVPVRIGTTPGELYFPYVSVVPSGEPLGEGKRQAAWIAPAQLRGSGDPAAELTAAVARAIRGVADERVN